MVTFFSHQSLKDEFKKNNGLKVAPDTYRVYENENGFFF